MSDGYSSLSNEGPCPFLWGYKSHVAKEYRVNGPISNTPGTNNCSFSSNEGQLFYPSGDNSDIAKKHVRYIEDIKNPLRSYFNQKQIILGKRNSSSYNKRSFNSQEDNNFFFLSK